MSMDMIHVLPPVQQGPSSSYGTNQTGSSQNSGRDQTQTTSDHWAYAEQGQINRTQLTKAVEHVNNELTNSTTKIEFEFDAKSMRYWVNVVDKTSGKVISEVPPEAVRKIVDGLTTSGITVDIKG